MRPKLTIDSIAQAAYLKLTKKKVVHTEIMDNGVVVDYDKHDSVVGIEFLNLSDVTRMLNKARRRNMSTDNETDARDEGYIRGMQTAMDTLKSSPDLVTGMGKVKKMIQESERDQRRTARERRNGR